MPSQQQFKIPSAEPARQVVLTAAQKAQSAIQQPINQASQIVSGAVNQASQAVNGAINSALQATGIPQAVNHINAGVNKFNNVLEQANGCVSKIQDMANGVAGALTSATNAVTAVSSVASGLQSQLNNAINSATSLATNAVGGIVGGALGAVSGAANAVSGALGAISAVPAALGNLASSAMGALGSMASSIGNAIMGAIGSCLGMAGALASYFKDQVTNTIGTVLEMQRSALATVDKAIKIVVDVAKQAMDDVLLLPETLIKEWPPIKKIEQIFQSNIAAISKITPAINKIAGAFNSAMGMVDSAMKAVSEIKSACNGISSLLGGGNSGGNNSSGNSVIDSMSNISDVYKSACCGNSPKVERYVAKNWPQVKDAGGNAATNPDSSRVSHTLKQQVQVNRRACSMENKIMQKQVAKQSTAARDKATNAAMEETLNPILKNNVNALNNYAKNEFAQVVDNVIKAQSVIQQIYDKANQDINNSNPIEYRKCSEVLFVKCDKLQQTLIEHHVVYEQCQCHDNIETLLIITDKILECNHKLEITNNSEKQKREELKKQIITLITQVQDIKEQLQITTAYPPNKPVEITNPFDEKGSDKPKPPIDFVPDKIPNVIIDDLLNVIKQTEQIQQRIEKLYDDVNPAINSIKNTLDQVNELVNKLREIQAIVDKIVNMAEEETNRIISNNLDIILKGIDEAEQLALDGLKEQQSDYDNIFDALEREAELIDTQKPEVLEQKDDSCQEPII